MGCSSSVLFVSPPSLSRKDALLDRCSLRIPVLCRLPFVVVVVSVVVVVVAVVIAVVVTVVVAVVVVVAFVGVCIGVGGAHTNV